jgi:hypothetical protein
MQAAASVDFTGLSAELTPMVRGLHFTAAHPTGPEIIIGPAAARPEVAPAQSSAQAMVPAHPRLMPDTSTAPRVTHHICSAEPHP